MNHRKIRVLIVDDSMVIRQMLSDLISQMPDMEVVGMASDGLQALEKIPQLNPDVVTLDIQMPRMDGLATLDAILQRHLLPVVMVSSLTQRGAEITLEALDRGAIDYIPKPESASQLCELQDELLRKIRWAAGADVQRILRIRQQRKQRQTSLAKLPLSQEQKDAEAESLADKCIAIGVSTGGPPALTVLFQQLQPPMPPIVVVQHMPPYFTKPLSWRLDSISRLSIKEAADGEWLRPNHVLIAPGGFHLELRKIGPQVKVRIFDGPPVSGHKPSVDVMMQSAAKIFGPRCVGVIMTGMGRDGADGCKAIRAAGGYVFGQDEASSDVYGMNKVAFQEGGVDRQFRLEEAASVLTEYVRKHFLKVPVSNLVR
ncbi:MAG: chemotaxis response regulator protein-glutamate methylesterase [Thermoguttaceae bacterium]|nr:chemotaxis response regulator protein-glutamate methylesterase [Thermoguttaceae bacterium]MDW8039381.1 chemotaxis response regulator protein-glutamate methylesterase [Thermoguttaceae bacterium]